MPIDELLTMVPPPASPSFAGTVEQLYAVEKDWGVAIPSDYKSLVLHYGAGSFINGYLQIWTPFSLDLRKRASERGSFLSVHHEAGMIPWPPFPATPGLLEIGSNENGHRLAYLADSTDDRWKVVAIPHGWESEIELWDLSLGQYLTAAFKNEIRTVCINSSQVVLRSEWNFRPLPARVASRAVGKRK